MEVPDDATILQAFNTFKLDDNKCIALSKLQSKMLDLGYSLEEGDVREVLGDGSWQDIKVDVDIFKKLLLTRPDYWTFPMSVITTAKSRLRMHYVKRMLRILILLGAWVSVAIVGGAIFHALESDNELKKAHDNAIVEADVGLLPGDWYCHHPSWEPPPPGACAGPDILHGGADPHSPQTDILHGGGRPHQSPQTANHSAQMPHPIGTPANTSDPPPDPPPGPPPGGGGGGAGGGGGGGGRRVTSVAVDTCNCTNLTAEVENLREQNNMLQNEKEALQDIVHNRKKTGKQLPADISNLQWTFAGSTFFAFQLMTTVGYGVFVPETDAGKVAAVLFGTIGIVVSGFALGAVTTYLDFGLDYCYNLIGARGRKRISLMAFKILATIFLIMAYVALVAFIAASRMRWSYGNAIYFVFITVSTIGLGDFSMTYGDGAQGVFEVLLQTIVIFPGLVLFAQFVNLGGTFTRITDEKAKAEFKAASRTMSELSRNASGMISSRPLGYEPKSSPDSTASVIGTPATSQNAQPQSSSGVTSDMSVI